MKHTPAMNKRLSTLAAEAIVTARNIQSQRQLLTEAEEKHNKLLRKIGRILFKGLTHCSPNDALSLIRQRPELFHLDVETGVFMTGRRSLAMDLINATRS